MDPASDRESLARRYAELGDAELRNLAHGDLDDVSLQIAHAELQSRALRRMPAPESVSLPDPFAADPYAPPQTRDSEATDTPSRRTQLGAVLWWIYVATLAVLALRSAHVSALRPGGAMQASLVNFSILAWGCSG
jgi:hypothetical protein